MLFSFVNRLVFCDRDTGRENLIEYSRWGESQTMKLVAEDIYREVNLYSLLSQSISQPVSQYACT